MLGGWGGGYVGGGGIMSAPQSTKSVYSSYVTFCYVDHWGNYNIPKLSIA